MVASLAVMMEEEELAAVADAAVGPRVAISEEQTGPPVSEQQAQKAPLEELERWHYYC